MTDDLTTKYQEDGSQNVILKNSANTEDKQQKSISIQKGLLKSILKQAQPKTPHSISDTIDGNDSDSKSQQTQRDSKAVKKKSIFQEYQERWRKNNKNLFRKLITWKIGDDGKIEDQLKLMITYLAIIFILILFISGAITSYSFNIKNKAIVQDSIFGQDYDTISQFPINGPGKMHYRTDPTTVCPVYTGTALNYGKISTECTDWYEYGSSVPRNINGIYQGVFPTSQLIAAFDTLNYVIEDQFLDYFTTQIKYIYFGVEQYMTFINYPGLDIADLDTYDVYSRPWYNDTMYLHLNSTTDSVFRVVTQPYDDIILGAKVITLSKSILIPNAQDTAKRYQVGKGQFLGVANVDILLSNFQSLFEDLHFYQSGYFMMVNYNGFPINQPSQFISMITQNGKVNITDTDSINISMLLSSNDWQKIQLNSSDNDSGYDLLQTTTFQGVEVIIAYVSSSENYYPQQGMINLIIVPKSDIADEITKQNDENFINLIIASFISFGIFLILIIICTYFIKKMMGSMVQSITELNQSALDLLDNNDEAHNEQNKTQEGQKKGDDVSRKQVMKTIDRIRKNTQSTTIKQLVKGFQNQLKGVQKIGKGEQNILKNCKNGIKYEKGEYSNTSIIEYMNPLIQYMNNTMSNIRQEQDLQQETSISERITYINSRQTHQLSTPFNELEVEDTQTKILPRLNPTFVERKFQSNSVSNIVTQDIPNDI